MHIQQLLNTLSTTLKTSGNQLIIVTPHETFQIEANIDMTLQSKFNLKAFFSKLRFQTK